MPRGVYIGLPPGDTIVIQLDAGPSRLSHRPSSAPPTDGARRLAGPAGESGTIAVLLMTQAWSLGRGNSAAVYRAITVAIPHPIWLMARGALGGGRLPQVRLRGAQAAFGPPTDRRPRRLRVVQAGVVGTVCCALWLRSGQAWQQCRASPEIFQRYGPL